jgi:hypothetical protein
VATLKKNLDASSAEAAMQILRAEKSASTRHIHALKQDEAEMETPAPSASAGGEGAGSTSSAEDIAKQIAAAG